MGDFNKKQVWEFSGAWTNVGSMPDEGRYDHACIFISSKGKRGIFVTGGSNGWQLQRSSLFYNLATNRWEEGPQLPIQRWGSKLVGMDGRYFLLGGGDGHNYIKQVLELDVERWTWTQLPEEINLMFPRTDFSALVVPA